MQGLLSNQNVFKKIKGYTFPLCLKMPRVPRLSIEQRVAIVRLYFSNGRNAYLTVSLFRREYPNYRTLCSSTVLRVVSKFVEHGTVQDRLKTNKLWKKENCSGGKERWHHCSENAADPNSEHKKTPSRDTIRCTEDPQEDPEDEARESSGQKMTLKQLRGTSDYILWTDEAIFHLDGHVNRQYGCRIIRS